MKCCDSITRAMASMISSRMVANWARKSRKGNVLTAVFGSAMVGDTLTETPRAVRALGREAANIVDENPLKYTTGQSARQHKLPRTEPKHVTFGDTFYSRALAAARL